MKKNQRGFTLVELMISVSLLAFIIAIVIAGITVVVFLSVDSDPDINKEHATQMATNWAAKMKVNPVAVDCLNRDTDGDGYVSCSISQKNDKGETNIIPIECSAVTSWNEGCRTPKASVY